jgi:3-hydroxyisobutyrate dehydrogenase-like beta-hydroxyacid dehydrogenase
MGNISVLGTGVMGAALARALAGAGQKVVVWNRSAERARALIGEHVRAVDNVDEAVAASRLVVVNLLDYEVSRRVLTTAGENLAGRIVVQTSTGTPEDANSFDSWLSERGAVLVEAAIMAYPKSIGSDESIVLYSGPEDAFVATDPLRHAWGGRQVWVGAEISLANGYDSSALTFYCGAISGFLEGAAIARAAGVPLNEYAKLTTDLWPAISYTAMTSIDLISKRDYHYEESPLSTYLNGLVRLTQAAEHAGVSDSFLAVLRDRVQRRIEAGGARQHVASVFEEFRPAQVTDLGRDGDK